MGSLKLHPKDNRLWFPAIRLNQEPIATLLEDLLVDRRLILELASGSGQHAVHFQKRFRSSSYKKRHRSYKKRITTVSHNFRSIIFGYFLYDKISGSASLYWNCDFSLSS